MDLAKMGRDELLELQANIKKRLKQFKPFRIKEVFRRCGVEGCYCMSGPADNEWGNLHGPYLYASWRDSGKTKTASLGKLYSAEEIAKLNNSQRPDWQFYFKISPKEYYALSPEKQRELWNITLSAQQFEEFHGLPKAEDTMDRYEKFYATRAGHDRYWSEWNLIDERQKVAYSEWAGLGVGTVKGVGILNDLVRRGYYFKE